MGRDSQIFACQLARCRSAEDAVLCPSDMMLCVISYWVLSGAKRRQIQQLRCCVLPAKKLKRRDVYLKLTRHNGRAGTHGTYNPKHNDRSFNLANSEHIDPERAKGNIYWDCFHGFRSALEPPDPDDLAVTFSEVERQFYETRYTTFIENQNERNAKIRHTERNRSIPDLLSSRKTCPEETIYQLGMILHDVRVWRAQSPSRCPVEKPPVGAVSYTKANLALNYRPLCPSPFLPDSLRRFFW